MIRADGIDILIDLSGHTSHNRLAMFARRPAPVQASWLGFWGTTGLSAMDYIISDAVTIPISEESHYTESVIRLPSGRFCYAPPQDAPIPTPPPCRSRGAITFGSFNNLTKIGPEVVRLWSAVLHAVPRSRLLLKWKTIADEYVRKNLTAAFAVHGIGSDRLVLRGVSPHMELLAQYGEVDIALDPFPFSGGLTSCEALWMGVPVVTFPEANASSRQTQGFLHAIGHTEWVASSKDDYVRIATELAADSESLSELRLSLRPNMVASPLCDGKAFTQGLETAYRTIWKSWCENNLPVVTIQDDSQPLVRLYEEKDAPVTNNNIKISLGSELGKKIILDIGSGHRDERAAIMPSFMANEWRRIRLDINQDSKPDILCSVLDMSVIGNESIDAVFLFHAIEHLYPNELPVAFGEILRVLKPDGFAIITCPDLQAAASLIADDKLLEAAYQAPIGPVTPFDIVYSHRRLTDRSKPYLAHHCGFTLKVLIATLKENGFPSIAGARRVEGFDLWVVASKNVLKDEEMLAFAKKMLPSV